MLAQVIDNTLFVKLNFFENLNIRFKENLSARAFALANFFNLTFGFSFRVLLLILNTVPAHFNFQIDRKSVYYRNSHAMKTP